MGIRGLAIPQYFSISVCRRGRILRYQYLSIAVFYMLSIVQKENGQLYEFIDYKNQIQELWQWCSNNERTKLFYAMQDALYDVESRL